MIHKREVGPVYVFENYLSSSFLPPLRVQMFTMVYVLVNKLGGSNIGIIKHDRLLGGLGKMAINILVNVIRNESN